MFNFSSPRVSVTGLTSTATPNTPAGVGPAAKPRALPPSLGMAACDASGSLTFLSPALRELLDQSFGSEVGTEPAAPQPLYRNDGVTRLRPEHLPLARARQGEVVADAVICHRSMDEVPTYLRCNAAPVATADGSICGAVVFIEDVTTEHVGQRNDQRMKANLVSALNHELRTPLTKLVGHVEMLQDMRAQLPLEAVHSLEKVCQAADELTELADLVSGLAEIDTPGGLTGASDETGDPSRDDATQIPEQLARGRLRSAPKVPMRPVNTLDPVSVSAALAGLPRNPSSPRSDG